MATAGAKSVELVRVGAVILENAKSRFPEYTSVAVLSLDRLVVIDKDECTLQLHSCHDGKLLAIYKLMAQPHDVCVVDTRQIHVAVTLMNAKIEILSVEPTDKYAVINWVTTLDVMEKFKYCHGVKALKSAEKLLVSGGNVKKDSKGYWICWGLVDKDVKIFEICQSGEPGYGSDSYLATSADDSMVYVSCFAGLRYEDNNGVYAFDVMDGSLKSTYHNIDLKNPKGISADGKGFIYVCNTRPPCIHQLTERMEAVAIHRNGMQTVDLVAIYWEKQHEELYVTIMGSGEVWRLHPLWSDQQVTLSKMPNQESSSTSSERWLLLGQPKMPSSEEVVQLWAKENGINASAVDVLLKEGFTSIEALKLLESDDLANTKIPSGQRKLIIVSVKRLIEKDTTQVQSIQLEHTDIFSKGNSQHGRQSGTTQQASSWTNSFYATRHQPLTALSAGTEDPYTHVMATTVHAYQELPPEYAIIGPTSALRRQELKNVRHLRSSLHSGIETPSSKDLRNNPQSGAAATISLVPILASSPMPALAPKSWLTPDPTTDSISSASNGPTSTYAHMPSPSAGVMQSPSSAFRHSTSAGSMPAPTFNSTTVDVMQAPNSGLKHLTTAGPLQGPKSISRAVSLLRAPTSSFTEADIMQTPTFDSTMADVMQATTNSFTPSTITGFMSDSASSSTADDIVRAPAYGFTHSTTAGPLQGPTSSSTATGLLQDLTSSFTRADGPTIDETDMFMHIACLLVNVGSRVLRRLLIHHAVTATCTLDQYLAKNRIAIDSLRKRRFLNRSQMDILFPMSGSSSLAEYDITLLSALFTNIVPTISQQQLNMIQFLRDKRNEIFGHARSVTLNLNDYHIFWNDICRTLVALSEQCGDPEFENEISREIQGTQVSTVRGTSFLDTLQTHPRRIETLERLVQDLISSRAQESDETSGDSDS